MTLTVRLDNEEERRLHKIIEALNGASQSDVIRQMINEKWLSLQANKTFVERRGGHPEHLIRGESSDSTRKTRKAKVASYLEKKASRRRKSASK